MNGFALRAGWLLDRLLGEPPGRHPVSMLGGWIERLERTAYAPSRLRGATVAGATIVPAAAVGALGGPLTVWACVAGRSLVEHARVVQTLLEDGDLESARTEMKALVGRDTSGLGATALSRAAVESVAESTVDAVVAPLLWTSVGGPAACAAHKAVNTLDSMVGHRTPRYADFGWASARLDDAMAWVPARVTALLVQTLRPGRPVLRTVLRDARRHPSPNAGVAEAAFAGALGVQLGGVNTYAGRTEDRGTLGDGRPPVPGDIDRACRLALTVGDLTAALAPW